LQNIKILVGRIVLYNVGWRDLNKLAWVS
jgi:hypothetical protein